MSLDKPEWGSFPLIACFNCPTQANNGLEWATRDY
jgi:hypothetical protein